MRIISIFLAVLLVFGVFMNKAYAQFLTGYADTSPVIEDIPVRVPEKTGYLTAPDYRSAPTTITPRTSQQQDEQPVDLVADNLRYEENQELVVATGNVELMQSGRILRADEVRYNARSDEVTATGRVILADQNGDVYFADTLTLQDEMRDGFVTRASALLSDGSRLSARDGQREAGVRTILNEAQFTACEPCEADPARPPLWQIKANKVTHDKEERRISYEDATFEVAGLPVAYTPYFSHSDGSVTQESGFLTPVFSFQSDLGAGVSNSYYWAMDPYQDATFGITAYTDTAPLGYAEYRRRWENASLETSGSITFAERNDQIGGVIVPTDEEIRGHVFANGLWDINQKWRAGMDLAYASDDQFLRRYNFSSEDVLENQLYLERFSGRNYGVVRALSFQDVRILDANEEIDQPDILPEVEVSFLGEPGSVPLISGRWGVNASSLTLQRQGREQDVSRFSMSGEWVKRLESNVGIVTDMTALGRGDIYYIGDRDLASDTIGRSREGTESRAFAALHAVSSYPLAREMDNAQWLVEPIGAVTVASNLDQEEFPNEDSQDVQIDSSNLFALNRFPGIDRIEDRSRATYGVRTALHHHNGNYGSFFFGQSYRFDENDNPFPVNSGLEEQNSDYVGEMSTRIGEFYDMHYRFQLENDNFSPRRHEVEANTDFGRLSLSGRYLYAQALEGNDFFDESREQVEANTGFYFTPEWRMRTGALHDLGDQPGLRTAYLGLDYFGQCLFLSATAQRNLTREESGDNSTEVFFRIGLKNLSDFEVSDFKPQSGLQ